jgi:hypothetical protein
MKKNLIIVATLGIALSGCVVTPRGGVYIPPAVVVVGAAVDTTAFVYEEGVVYPEYEKAYLYDPMIGAFYFVGRNGYRHNMPYSWNYRNHGVPHGVYHNPIERRR